MSPELIGILGVGIGLLTAMIALAALGVSLMGQSERRTAEQIAQLREHMHRRFDEIIEDMQRRIDEANGEMPRWSEQNQDHLAGQFDADEHYSTHHAGYRTLRSRGQR